MKTLCMYATVRFMPFAETQEFANIGIVVCAPDKGKIEFKLARKRFARINQFFDDLDCRLFGKAIEMVNAELNRLKQFAYENPGKRTADLFDELTRHREGVVYFGKVSTAIVNNVDEKLNNLFEHYVERRFLTEQYRETVLERNIRTLFKTKNISGFGQKELNTNLGSFRLPFVRKTNKGLEAIKPIAFERKTPLAAYEHTKQWVDRLTRLNNEGIIISNCMLLAVEKPTKNEFYTAYTDAINAAKMHKLLVANVNDENAILTFAQS